MYCYIMFIFDVGTYKNPVTHEIVHGIYLSLQLSFKNNKINVIKLLVL